MQKSTALVSYLVHVVLFRSPALYGGVWLRMADLDRTLVSQKGDF